MTDTLRAQQMTPRSGTGAPAEVVGQEGAGSGAADLAHWRAVAAATGPADREAAEAGVRRAYRGAGLAEPKRILWADSPRAAVTLLVRLAEAGELGSSVRNLVRNGPWAQARERLHARLGPGGWGAHWNATGGRLWDTTQMLVDRIRTGIVVELAAPSRTVAGARDRKSEMAIRLMLLDAVLGQQEAAWLSAFDSSAAGSGAEPDSRLDGLAQVARSAGWWWPYERVAVVCERPTELHRDEAGRLDNATGPALAFPDGFALHAWRGMPVPADFLAGLAGLTPQRIRDEENAELRRVMLEHFGYDRYLTESGAEPVHRDVTGILWRVQLPGDEDVVMVEVVNSTPEPDGTHRTYWLRVPPRTRTAREGVAWTFGLEADAYEPQRET
ncbi:DUF6745 domain-containing protein [Streptomyces sp. NPDC001904]|uniref:DUF6745 domain-containing protein n=1 Tax=Streptomyces sp. NPDC001904 TaxID=3154531 RepID=UPI003323B110